MSTSHEQYFTASNLCHRHEQIIESRFGLTAHNAIPQAYRPHHTSIGYALLVHLSELALQVPDLSTFQQRLAFAREHRSTGYQVSGEDFFLQPCDAVEAIEGLAAEKLIQLSLANAHANSIPVTSVAGAKIANWKALEQREKEETRQTALSPLKSRANLTRSSKSAAGAKIAEWTSRLKPTRKASAKIIDWGAESNMLAVTDKRVDSQGGEDELPVRRGIRRMIEVSRGSVPEDVGRPVNQDVSRSVKKGIARPVKRPRYSLPSPPGKPIKHCVFNSSSSLDGSDVSFTPSLTMTSDRTSRASMPVEASISAEGSSPDYVEKQKEHANFFTMPEDQHFKRARPRTFVQDITQITDFNSLKYPVEVAWKRGENLEICTAEELREYADEVVAKRRCSLRSDGALLSPYTTEPNTSPPKPSPIPDVQPSHKEEAAISPLRSSRQSAQSDQSSLPPSPVRDVQTLLDCHIQRFNDGMLSVSAAAVRTHDLLTRQDRDKLDNMMVSFVNAVKDARLTYEAGLIELCILPGADVDDLDEEDMESLFGSASAQKAWMDVTDQLYSQQDDASAGGPAASSDTTNSITDEEVGSRESNIVDLTIGYISDGSDD